MDDKILVAIIAVVGVIIGGAINVVSTYCLEGRKQKAESRRLALAFQGEISALLGIIKRRRYVEICQAVIEEMERTQEKIPITVHVRREYFLVFKTNVGNIGLLECPLPQLIAQFYVQANSVLEDMESHRDGTMDEMDVTYLIEITKEMRALLEETVNVGEEIIKETTRLPNKSANAPRARCSAQ